MTGNDDARRVMVSMPPALWADRTLLLVEQGQSNTP